MDREVDQELVERAQKGDKRAFDLLVLKYQRKLARLLSRMVRDPAEIEGITQESFIKAYRALPQFRGESAFYTEVTGYTVNSIEGAAFRIRQLLDSPDLMARLGGAAREYVRRNFLITRHLGDYLALLASLTA